MADEKNPKPGLFAQTLAKAVDLWRILVGLLVSFREQTRAFIEWLADEKPGKPLIPWREWNWHAIGVFVDRVPLYWMGILICLGLGLNLLRAEVSGTPTADPNDGGAYVSADLPQIHAWFYLAALWMFLRTVVEIVKIIKPRIDVRVS